MKFQDLSNKAICIVFGGLFLGMLVACGPSDRREAGEGPLGTIQQSLDTVLVPTMSSNTSPSGIVTRSGVYSSSYEAWQAFDATTGTLWLSNMYTSSVWIGYEWGSSQWGEIWRFVSSYQITYANGSCCEQRGPKNWTLQGWDGSTWVTVDTVTNQTGWYSNPVRTYTVAAPGTYAKYRLNVTADNYNNPTYPITLVSIASLALYGPDPGTPSGCEFVKPTNLAASTGDTTASLSWYFSGNLFIATGGWQVVWSTDPYLYPSSGFFTGSMATRATISGLTPGTTYYWAVWGDCGSIPGGWSDISSFTTTTSVPEPQCSTCGGLTCHNSAYCTYALDCANCCCNATYVAPGADCPQICP